LKIVVINSGSSSLKVKIFNDNKVVKSYLVEHIGESGSEILNYHQALDSLNIDFLDVDVIGHRVVHGGEYFTNSVLIDNNVLKKIKMLSSLAPLHNPANLEGIKVAMHYAKDTPQVAVFDTAFHATMPKESFLYAIDYDFYKKHNIRKYGFHGTSHSYLLKQSAKILNKDIDKLNIITLHLGNGASACAIKNGKSIDTSMGFTPLEGLIMGTRCGDIDPAVLIYLQRQLGYSVDEVDNELNKHSGLFGIAKNNDVRELLKSSSQNAKLAVDMMIRRVQKYIGSYMAILEDVDAIVFSGGIGENSDYIRKRVMSSKMFKDIKSIVIKTDEELEIANECRRVLQAK